MASNISESEVEVEEEPAGGYIELECVDSPFSDSSSSSEHESENENDDIELDGVGDDADEAHVPQKGANPYLFEPLLPEGAPPRDEPAAVNPAIQERLQVLDWFVSILYFRVVYNNFRMALMNSVAYHFCCTTLNCLSKWYSRPYANNTFEHSYYRCYPNCNPFSTQRLVPMR
ncbi:uncharacterized protein [Apostichopus japonicus]|uniref:uncharacterized protein isoform X2 n=1 Tax=Stichopus japonicus TaxID=307972 RepID=UPI003AB2B405